jgi:WD40 repeat protein
VYFYDAQMFAPLGFWETGHSVGRVVWSPRGDVIVVVYRPDSGSQIAEARAAADGAVLWSLTETSPTACYWYGYCYTSPLWRWKWSFSPDGARLAIARNAAVELRDAVTGALVQTLQSGDEWAYESVAFGPDGRLAACCADHYTQIWDAAAGQVAYRLHAQADQMVWSPDGRALSTNGTLWNVAQQRPLDAEGYGYRFGSHLLAFSPDGKWLAGGDGYGPVRLWLMRSGAMWNLLLGHKSAIVDLAWASDGTLYSAGDNTVRAWDVIAGKQVRALSGFGPATRLVAWSADGQRVYSVENEQLIAADLASRLPVAVAPLPFTQYCWTYESQQYCNRYSHDARRVLASPAGDVIAVATNSEIALYEAGTLRLVRQLPTNYPVFHLAFSPDGKSLASGGDSPYVVVWDVAAGLPQRALLASPQKAFVVALAFSADGQTLYSLDGAGELHAWGMGASAQTSGTTHDYRLCWFNYPARQTETFHDECGYQIGAAAISPSAGRVVVEQSAGLAVSDLSTGQLLYTLDAANVRAVAVNPQGTRLAAISGNVATIWKLDTGQLIARYSGHTEPIRALAFRPDGRSLATGGQDGTVRVWAVP